VSCNVPPPPPASRVRAVAPAEVARSGTPPAARQPNASAAVVVPALGRIAREHVALRPSPRRHAFPPPPSRSSAQAVIVVVGVRTTRARRWDGAPPGATSAGATARTRLAGGRRAVAARLRRGRR